MSVKVLSRSSQSQMGCVALSRLWPFIFTQSGFQWLLCCHLAHEGCGFDSLPWASSSVCGLCAVTPPSSHTPWQPLKADRSVGVSERVNCCLSRMSPRDSSVPSHYASVWPYQSQPGEWTGTQKQYDVVTARWKSTLSCWFSALHHLFKCLKHHNWKIDMRKFRNQSRFTAHSRSVSRFEHLIFVLWPFWKTYHRIAIQVTSSYGTSTDLRPINLGEAPAPDDAECSRRIRASLWNAFSPFFNGPENSSLQQWISNLLKIKVDCVIDLLKLDW